MVYPHLLSKQVSRAGAGFLSRFWSQPKERTDIIGVSVGQYRGLEKSVKLQIDKMSLHVWSGAFIYEVQRTKTAGS